MKNKKKLVIITSILAVGIPLLAIGTQSILKKVREWLLQNSKRTDWGWKSQRKSWKRTKISSRKSRKRKAASIRKSWKRTKNCQRKNWKKTTNNYWSIFTKK